MSRSPSQIWGRGRRQSCKGRATSLILEAVSRRRQKRPQVPHHAPSLTATTEDFSDQELEFFRRGDELNPPTGEASDSSDADA